MDVSKFEFDVKRFRVCVCVFGGGGGGVRKVR